MNPGLYRMEELHGTVMVEEPRRCFLFHSYKPFYSLVYHHYSCCLKYATRSLYFSLFCLVGVWFRARSPIPCS